MLHTTTLVGDLKKIWRRCFPIWDTWICREMALKVIFHPRLVTKVAPWRLWTCPTITSQEKYRCCWLKDVLVYSSWIYQTTDYMAKYFQHGSTCLNYHFLVWTIITSQGHYPMDCQNAISYDSWMWATTICQVKFLHGCLTWHIWILSSLVIIHSMVRSPMNLPGFSF